MKKDLYTPKRAAIVVMIALLVSGVFVMTFLTGCAIPDYTVVTIAEHPNNISSSALADSDGNTSASAGGGKGGSIDPSGEISGKARSRCK